MLERKEARIWHQLYICNVFLSNICHPRAQFLSAPHSDVLNCLGDVNPQQNLKSQANCVGCPSARFAGTHAPTIYMLMLSQFVTPGLMLLAQNWIDFAQGKFKPKSARSILQSFILPIFLLQFTCFGVPCFHGFVVFPPPWDFYNRVRLVFGSAKCVGF